MMPSGAIRMPAFTAVGEPLASFDALPFWRLLQDAALDFPDRIALIFNDDSLTYRELAGLVDRAAAGLQAMGVVQGDRIGICMPNHPAAVIMLYAAMRAGGTAVMLSPINAAPALIGQATDAELAALVTFDERSELSEKMDAVTAAVGIPRLVVVNRDLSSWRAEHRKSQPPPASCDSICRIYSALGRCQKRFGAIPLPSSLCFNIQVARPGLPKGSC